jgi:tetratricopeptide (TPR) repeat protein
MRNIYIALLIFSLTFLITLNSCQNGRIRKADLYIDNKEFREAEQVLKKEIESNPNNIDAYYVLGAKVYAPTREYSKMNTVFDSVTAKSETYTQEIQEVRQNFFAQEIETGTKLFQNAIQDSIIQKSLIDSAIYHYENAVTIKPDAIDAKIQLIRSYQHLEKSSMAISMIQDVIDTHPNNSKLLHLYGKILIKQNQFDDAAEHLERAYELNPSNPEVINTLLDAYENSGNIKRARSTLEKAIKNFPENSTLHFQLAHFYTQISKKAKKEEQKQSFLQTAIGFQEKGLKISSQNLGEKLQLGTLYEEAGMWNKAISTYEDLLEKSPNNRELIRRLSNAAYRSSDPVRAKKALEKLKKMQQN